IFWYGIIWFNNYRYCLSLSFFVSQHRRNPQFATPIFIMIAIDESDQKLVATSTHGSNTSAHAWRRMCAVVPCTGYTQCTGCDQHANDEDYVLI
ncbi:MAG TPA: hypothetical protein VEF04_00430, partial [Blastocatellia bacterium]|nr:hypothetical protein [Blastocatellia bacterium]